MPLLDGFHLLCSNRGRLSFVVGRKSIRAVLDQFLYAAVRALDQGPVKRCKSHVINGFDVRAPSEQYIYTCWITLVCRPHQTRMTLRILYVDWNVRLVKQEYELENIAVQCRTVEKVVTGVICHQGICAVLEEKVDDIEVAFLRGPQDRRSLRVSSFRINVGTGL